MRSRVPALVKGHSRTREDQSGQQVMAAQNTVCRAELAPSGQVSGVSPCRLWSHRFSPDQGSGVAGRQRSGGRAERQAGRHQHYSTRYAFVKLPVLRTPSTAQDSTTNTPTSTGQASRQRLTQTVEPHAVSDLLRTTSNELPSKPWPTHTRLITTHPDHSSPEVSNLHQDRPGTA